MIRFDYAAVRNPVWKLPRHHLRDPAVLVHDGLVYLYFTYFDPAAVTWHVAMSTTEDFLGFSEVRVISPAGYASPGNVLRVGGRWALCCQDYRALPHRLCLAWSDDLVNWSPPAVFFNTGPENRWNTDGRVIDPYIVPWEGRFYCYYTGSTRLRRGGVGHNLIGLCVSDDFVRWRDVSTEAPVIGVDFDWEEPDGNENNCVVRAGERWVMLYSASLKHQKIAWAESDDLVHWRKGGLCDVPVPDYVKHNFGAPFVIEGLDPSGPYTMIYQAGLADGHMVFMLLQSRDLVEWR